MDCLNRRMPNGTSGGVGAGAGNRPGYPILFKPRALGVAIPDDASTAGRRKWTAGSDGGLSCPLACRTNAWQ